MRYEPIIECVAGEQWRYHVSSKSNPSQTHLCDLTENWPLGECGCSDYICRRLPAFRKTGNPVRCIHLNACRETLMNFLIKQTL